MSYYPRKGGRTLEMFQNREILESRMPLCKHFANSVDMIKLIFISRREEKR